MSSEELKESEKTLETEGKMTPKLRLAFQQAMRKVKNKESAKASRERNKANFKTWQEYARHLKKMLEERGIEAPPEPVVAPDSGRFMRNAGFCVMFVILAVGIIFNAAHRTNRENSVVTSNGENSLVSQPAPQAVSQPASQADESDARVFIDSKPPLNEPTPPESNSQLMPSLNSVSEELAPVEVIRKSAYMSYDTEVDDSSLALVIPDQKQQVPPPSSVSDLVPTLPVMVHTKRALFGEAEPPVADGSWCLDNRSYVFVKDAVEIAPRSAYRASSTVRTEPSIGLLIPASSFDIDSTDPESFVALNCLVENATLVPRSVLAHSLFERMEV